jgi:DNA-binding response OmpR family regulator
MKTAQDQALILIVDDNPANLDVLSAALTRADLEVAVASDGEMALEQIHGEPPMLVLLDIHLPGIDGFETCRRLKADPATREIPVIFMTALADTIDKVRGFELGAVDYITKPFQQDEALARIQAHLGVRRLTLALAERNGLLEKEVQERAAAEAALSALTRELERRTAELGDANARLSTQLAVHRETEAARAELQREVIVAQRRRLEELSTPLIPITSRLVVMPLIGTMDSARAEQVLETALLGVSAQRAEVVILDVTGVKQVDAVVAGTLLRTAAALRLLGAQTVITGVRPDVATTLAALDLDLRRVVTLGTLESGIAYALGRLGASAQVSRPPPRGSRRGGA